MRYLFFIILILCISCYRITEIEIPSGSPQMVVNSLFSPDSVWQVYVSKSIDLLDTTRETLPLSDALVVISDEFNTKDTLKFVKGRFISDKKPQIDKTYTLTVNAKGFPIATATDRVPQNIKEVKGFLDTSFITIDTDVLLIPIEYYTASISIEDNQNEKNFYRIEGETYDKKYIKKDSILLENLYMKSGLSTQDAGAIKLSKEQPYILLEDKFFDNKKYTLTGLIGRNIFLNDLIYFNVPLDSQMRKLQVFLDFRSLSENAFLYEKSYITQQYNKVDPFAEPNNVYSNIKNGYGIFGGYQKKRVRIF